MVAPFSLDSATVGRPRLRAARSACTVSVVVPDRDKPGTDKILLNKVTFKALPGDLIALMGPSGAGKTTLLTVLNGYLRPT